MFKFWCIQHLNLWWANWTFHWISFRLGLFFHTTIIVFTRIVQLVESYTDKWGISYKGSLTGWILIWKQGERKLQQTHWFIHIAWVHHCCMLMEITNSTKKITRVIMINIFKCFKFCAQKNSSLEELLNFQKDNRKGASQCGVKFNKGNC